MKESEQQADATLPNPSLKIEAVELLLSSVSALLPNVNQNPLLDQKPNPYLLQLQPQ
jgi:hypothetical protein